MAQPGRPGPGPLGLLRFLDLTEAQDKAVKAVLDRHRPIQAGRMRALADRESALRQGLEDPALSEAQIRGLQAAESEARLQAVLEERAAFLEIRAILSGEQQAKALRLRQKLEKEREARLDLMAETGGPGPEPGPMPRP
jgi:Spy/CpxP family protein refolding chaperone